jgi:hypothetical protein
MGTDDEAVTDAPLSGGTPGGGTVGGVVGKPYAPGYQAICIPELR